MGRFKAVYLVVFLLLVPVNALCEDARIDDVTVNYNSDLNLSFTVKGAFTEDIIEAINSGIPTSFTFIVELYRTRRMWFDEHLGTWRFTHTVRYDSLKEEYEVELGEKKSHVRTKDFKEMKRLMVRGENFTIKPSKKLREGEEYTLKIKAELDTIKLPFFLDYMLFFVRLWDFETDWYTHTFSP